MKPNQRESLSALADDALDGDALRFLLRGLENDPASLQTWARYHLAGDVLRNQCDRIASEGFAARVSACVENLQVDDKLQLDNAAAVPAARYRWLRWSGGGVIAAGVAAVALMAAQPRVPAPVTAPIGVAISASTLPTARTQASITPRAQRQPSSPAQAPRWLSAGSAAQMTQPAAATFYGFGQGANTLAPATYSRQMAPYMQIRSARMDDVSRRPHRGAHYILRSTLRVPAGARAPSPAPTQQ